MGKKLTKQKLKDIQALARKIRTAKGYKTISVKKYNMKQCDAVKQDANSILHKPKQKKIRFKY